MKELLNQFELTLGNHHFSRGEKQALRKLLKEKSFTPYQFSIIRNKFYDLAHSQLPSQKSKKIINWLKEAEDLIFTRAASSFKNQVYFSPGNDCLNAIIKAIRSVKNEMLLCVFTITDNRITEEIIASHHRGIDIRIITDNDKSEDKGSDIKTLRKLNIPLVMDKTSNHMHHKFAIFDRKTCLTGSYNWTKSAERHNQENILLTEDPKIIKAYLKEFEKLWQQFSRKRLN